MTTATIIHECAHYVRRDIGHYASELPPFHGSTVKTVEGVEHGKKDDELNASEAAPNAYSDAQFAVTRITAPIFDSQVIANSHSQTAVAPIHLSSFVHTLSFFVHTIERH